MISCSLPPTGPFRPEILSAKAGSAAEGGAELKDGGSNSRAPEGNS